MPCCFGQQGIYSSEIQVTTPTTPGGITAGSYNLVVHAPEWAPDIIVQAAAALKDALTGQFSAAWTIAFGTYTVVDKPNGDTVETDALGSQTVGSANLSGAHKDLVYPFTLTAKSTGQVLPQLEEIAAIIGAIAVVLVVFGILWLVIEIDKALGGAGGIFWIIIAIAAVLLLSEPSVRKSIGTAASKATKPATKKKASKT